MRQRQSRPGAGQTVLVSQNRLFSGGGFGSSVQARISANGGAIALGHPLGATGAKLTAQLLSELSRRGGGYGLVTMCIGGGMGAAGVFEVYPA